MTFKRKTELRFVQMEKRIEKIMESLLRLSKQDVDTLKLIEGMCNLYESKNKTKGRKE